MEYADGTFWEEYGRYVQESMPRHRRVIEMLLTTVPGGDFRVLDLGCGQVMEGFRLMSPEGQSAAWYRGVDRDPHGSAISMGLAWRMDYGDVAALCKRCHDEGFMPDIVVSLFSAEVVQRQHDAEALYRGVLAGLPSVRAVLSVGFFYEGKEHEPTVIEPGGLVSFQTIGPHLKGDLRETRVVERGPSELFGPNVIEVWRLIERADRKD